jgi:8-oxo-dGTP diphosphatase
MARSPAVSEPLRVAAAVLFDAAGSVLITQRPAGKYLAGYWEFPGGKLDSSESAEQALARELREELGIELRRCHRLLELRHDYAERAVHLEVFVVDESCGEPSGLEGQALKWVSMAALGQENLLPADRPIVEALIANEEIVNGAGHRTAGHSAR